MFDKEISKAFATKVYTILSVQFLYKAAQIALYQIILSLSNGYKLSDRSRVMLGLSIIIVFVSLFALTCVKPNIRSFPKNFILLSLLTFGTSIIGAYFTYAYQTKAALYTMITCAVSTISLSIFTKLSPSEMTNCRPQLCISTVANLVVGVILAMEFHPDPQLIWSIFVAFVLCLFLIYDTHLVMSGRYGELSPEEYFIGAISVYTHFIYLLIVILIAAIFMLSK